MSLALFGTVRADDSIKVKNKRYTFGDFFDALDLPTVLGAGVTPNGIESATFNSAMRLAWRQHKNYGMYAFVSYDAHSNTYDSLMIKGSNVSRGEVWYHEVGMGVGYRLPLVKDIKAFYETPHFHPWDFFCSIEPGAVITVVKDAVPLTEESVELQDRQSVVPSLRFSAGVEWFIMSNFGVFLEAAYTQHLMPTLIEEAAINQGLISTPSGPLTFSVGLSLFFN